MIGVVAYLVQYSLRPLQVAKGQDLVAYAHVTRRLRKHICAENTAIVVVCLQLLEQRAHIIGNAILRRRQWAEYEKRLPIHRRNHSK
jgi:hypothetical protein